MQNSLGPVTETIGIDELRCRAHNQKVPELFEKDCSVNDSPFIHANEIAIYAGIVLLVLFFVSFFVFRRLRKKK